MSTLELLEKEFEGPTAPLADVSVKYLGISPRKAADMATAGTLPMATFRLGSQKSPWLVSLVVLADFIDRKAAAALSEWNEGQPVPWPIECDGQ